MTNSAVNVRALALTALMEILEENGHSHIVIRQMLKKKEGLSKQERAFFTRLVEGTLEEVLFLDYVLNQYSKVKVKKLKPVMRTALRMSLYQIFFMDSVPKEAACDECVKLIAKRGLSGLKGYANGVLRTIIREKDNITLPDPKKQPLEYYSLKGSLPTWLVEKWLAELGEEELARMIEVYRIPQPTTVRCHFSAASREEILESLKKDGVTVEECPYLTEALYLVEYERLESLEAWQKGWIQVQDVSSMLVTAVADPQEGDNIIDVCAAPGGKSLHLADRLRGTGKVSARDLTEKKTALIKENVSRMGCKNIEVVQADAGVLRMEDVQTADIVVADLPCSGLGVIGKKPDIKYHVTSEQQLELAALQRELLKTVQNYVKPGGKLIYSTCTIAKEENLENVEWFTKNYPFKLVSMDEVLPKEFHSETTKNGYLQLLPGTHRTDGFFIASMICTKERE